MAHPICQRDENGWYIPRHNTISHHIYLALKRGLSTSEIAKLLGRSNTSSVRVLAWKIRHPDKASADQRRRYWADQEKREIAERLAKL